MKSALNVHRGSGALPWVGLACILALYAFCVLRVHPANFFGLMQDDAIYFSSARELAQGHGYILPSVPGTPPATKYPILYPWVLSWVWRWNPSFPANLSQAVGVNIAFGALFLTAAFVFLRRLEGLGTAGAFVLTTFFAVHPRILLLSGDLMSDVPFAALALIACVLAAKAVQKDSGLGRTVLCGIITGLSVLMRVLGLPVAAGVYAAMAWRGGWKKSTVFAGCVLPFAVALLWRSVLNTPKALPVAVSACSHSWRMTWLYYTSYFGFWKADTVSNFVFWKTSRNSLFAFVNQPADYFLGSLDIKPLTLAFLVLFLLSAVCVRGMFRQARDGGWQPIHFVLPFYLLPVSVWNYGGMDRFLLTFLPLFGAGLWIEARLLVGQVRDSLRKPGINVEKMASSFFLLAAVALILRTGAFWWRETQGLKLLSKARSGLGIEKREAYDWLKLNTPPDARVLAYEDVNEFLYSARRAMRPTTFSPASRFRPEILDAELSCITSSAEPIGARYWIISSDDFGLEGEAAQSQGRSKEAELTKSLRPLFHSHLGRVSVYGLTPNGHRVAGCSNRTDLSPCDSSRVPGASTKVDQTVVPPEVAASPSHKSH